MAQVVRADDTTVAYSDPYENGKAVTPADGDDLPAPGTCRALYIGVAGDVKIDMPGGEDGLVFTAVPVGVLFVRADRVYAAGTTATNIVALY